MRTLIACMLASALWTSSALPATWHINNRTGNDAANGVTPETAFASIAKAIRKAGVSDTLVLANTGKAYREPIILHRLGGTPAKPFIIEGNGAVIDGFRTIAPKQWQARKGGIYFYPYADTEINDLFAGRKRRMTPHIFHADTPLKQLRKAGPLPQEATLWNEKGVLWRLPPGRSPADYGPLRLTALENGVEICDSSYIVIRNLTVTGCHNDGFNVHGNSQGIFCENIVAHHNGDDGFSIHEDATAVVRNAHLHHNAFGVQDVHASRSSYFGVVAEKNRRCGFSMHGGIRTITDSVARDNPVQITVTASGAKHLKLPKAHLASEGMTVLKNVVASGGDVGLLVKKGGRVAISNCVFSGAKTGIKLASGVSCHMNFSIVSDSKVAEMDIQADKVTLNNNIYFPGRIRWKKRSFAPEAWTAWQKTSGQDGDSQITPPEFDSVGMLKVAAEARPKQQQLTPGLSAPQVTNRDQ
jgi:Right handed beta helix region